LRPGLIIYRPPPRCAVAKLPPTAGPDGRSGLPAEGGCAEGVIADLGCRRIMAWALAWGRGVVVSRTDLAHGGHADDQRGALHPREQSSSMKNRKREICTSGTTGIMHREPRLDPHDAALRSPRACFVRLCVPAQQRCTHPVAQLLRFGWRRRRGKTPRRKGALRRGKTPRRKAVHALLSMGLENLLTVAS
jgi:hypothetical protein